MSFKRKGPGVFVSASLGALAGALLVGGTIVLLTYPAFPAFAQAGSNGKVDLQ